jgi:membrane-associated protein
VLLSALSLDPKQILDSLSPYGEIGLFFILFAENGLLFGFFLPGDSLLFTAGLLASQGKMNLALVVIGCLAAAVIGDQVGFTIGRSLGPRLLRRPDSRLFKRELHQSNSRILRTSWTQDRSARALRTRSPHVYASARRRREHAPSDVPELQRRRRVPLGLLFDHGRIRAR